MAVTNELILQFLLSCTLFNMILLKVHRNKDQNHGWLQISQNTDTDQMNGFCKHGNETPGSSQRGISVNIRIFKERSCCMKFGLHQRTIYQNAISLTHTHIHIITNIHYVHWDNKHKTYKCKLEGCLTVHLPHEIIWNAN